MRTVEAEPPESETRVQPEDEGVPAQHVEGRPHLHVVEAADEPGITATTETVNAADAVPRVQIEAWHGALANRREDGYLPTGHEIAARFDHKERWGRLIKQWGQKGRFDGVSA